MTTYTLNLWTRGNVSRVYVNAADGSSLGFFQETIHEAARGTSTYYDAHRVAKGDAVTELGRDYTCTLTADVMAAIYAAPAIAADIERSGLADDWQKFNSLCRHARGYAKALIGSKAQIAEAKKREKFTVEI